MFVLCNSLSLPKGNNAATAITDCTAHIILHNNTVVSSVTCNRYQFGCETDSILSIDNPAVKRCETKTNSLPITEYQSGGIMWSIRFIKITNMPNIRSDNDKWDTIVRICLAIVFYVCNIYIPIPLVNTREHPKINPNDFPTPVFPRAKALIHFLENLVFKSKSISWLSDFTYLFDIPAEISMETVGSTNHSMRSLKIPKGVIRSRESKKDIQWNDQQKKNKKD